VSLKNKFSLLIVFIVFSILLVVCSVLAYRSISGLETDLREKDTLISENLLPKLLGDLGDYYTYQYQRYVSSVEKALEENPDITYFRIINAQNEVIFETSEIKEGKTSGNPPKKIDDPKIKEVIQTKQPYQDIIVVDNERYIRVIAPYIDNFDVFRNLIEFHFSLKAVEKAIGEIVLFFLIFLVAFTIIGLTVAAFFSGLITKPLTELTAVASKIAGGDLSQKANILTSDEVGSLAGAFNQMVTTLKQKIDQLHYEHIKLEASINSLSVGFIMVDRNNNIMTINHAARQTLCASADSPLATLKDCTLTHIEDELQGVVNLRAFINQCFEQKKAITIREVKFQNRYMKIFITPIVTIGVIGAVILIDDITEAKVMERAKEEFFSIASHELRTPLTAIRGNTSMIQQFYSDKITDPELKEMIGDIHESSIRLIAIVNDFLDTSRLEMGKMEFKKEQFDVVKVAENTIKEYMTTGSMKKLYLKLEPPAAPLSPVLGDQNKLKQVMVNIVGNAIKFTETGGITVKFASYDKFIKIFIVDTGRGISKESQNLLFRKFQQAQDNILTRDTTKGTGLGLYISRLIMNGMGGQIKIESSELGKGTTFSISIPVAIAEPPTTTTQTQQGAIVPPAVPPAAPQPANPIKTSDTT
jgi:signal transduction histidine kinase/HAMP domain-containing protein